MDLKNNIVGGVLVLVALVAGALFGGGAPVAEKLAGTPTEVKEWFVNGIQLGGQNEVWLPTRTVGAGDNNDGWYNNTGRTVYVDLVAVTSSGTASTTMTIDVATSTTENISNYTSPFSEVVDSYQLSTSSPAKTINSMKNAGTNGLYVIPVEAGEYLSLLLSAGEPGQTGAPTCSGSVCETATSTNRGFNLDWRIHYFYEGEN